MVCFYDVVAIATQAEFIPQLKQRAFFRMSCKPTLLSGIICNICGIVYEEALSWNYPSSSKK